MFHKAVVIFFEDFSLLPLSSLWELIKHWTAWGQASAQSEKEKHFFLSSHRDWMVHELFFIKHQLLLKLYKRVYKNTSETYSSCQCLHFNWHFSSSQCLPFDRHFNSFQCLHFDLHFSSFQYLHFDLDFNSFQCLFFNRHFNFFQCLHFNCTFISTSPRSYTKIDTST